MSSVCLKEREQGTGVSREEGGCRDRGGGERARQEAELRARKSFDCLLCGMTGADLKGVAELEDRMEAGHTQAGALEAQAWRILEAALREKWSSPCPWG